MVERREDLEEMFHLVLGSGGKNSEEGAGFTK